MSANSKDPNVYTAPSDAVSPPPLHSYFPDHPLPFSQVLYQSANASRQNTPQQQDRSVFHSDHKKHECHHYMSTYGGAVMNAMAFGFGSTLGADAANGFVLEAS